MGSIQNKQEIKLLSMTEFVLNQKEKAKELIDKMAFEVCKTDAKQCALIAVDEILNVIDRDMNYQNVYSFYLEVKTEIELL